MIIAKCDICESEITYDINKSIFSAEDRLKRYTYCYKEWFIIEKKLYFCIHCIAGLNELGKGRWTTFKSGKDYITNDNIKNKILNKKEELNRKLRQLDLVRNKNRKVENIKRNKDGSLDMRFKENR